MLAAMSYISPDIVKAVRSRGFKTIGTPPYKGLSEKPEAAHADMQIKATPEGDIFLIKNNEPFNKVVLDELPQSASCVTLTEDEIYAFSYPYCVKLNAAVVGRHVIGNLRYLDKKMTERLKALGYEFINVKQGYAGCSTAVVSGSAVITSDSGVAKATAACGIDVLTISPGHIGLCKSYGGFIGGASFLADKGTLAFTGDVTRHPDYIRIESFCAAHGVKTLSLTDAPLLDIGGIVRIL